MSSDEASLTRGTVFAGYTVQRLLGEGGFGAVYEAYGFGQRVALKVLRREVADNEEVVTRFMREAQTVAQLRHPNIVTAVDMGSYEGYLYLAMELLEGETLSDCVTRLGALSLPFALDVLLPVMSAMQSAHTQSIVHRDLKPDNIFLTYGPDGAMHPKVLDFGFAKIVQPGMQLTRPDTAIGTPNFMSPEQMNAPLKVDLRSDVWALGVLLYYVLTGERPFAGRTLIATLKNVLESEVPSVRLIRPDIPAEIDEIIGRALRKRPEARYGSVREFATALLPFASEMTALVYASELAGNTVWEELDVDTNPALRVPDDVEAVPSIIEPADPRASSFGEADTLIHPGPVVATIAPPSVEPHVVTQKPEPPPRRTWLTVVGVAGLGIAAATVGVLFANAPTPQGLVDDPPRATAHPLQVSDGGADAGADARVR